MQAKRTVAIFLTASLATGMLSGYGQQVQAQEADLEMIQEEAAVEPEEAPGVRDEVVTVQDEATIGQAEMAADMQMEAASDTQEEAVIYVQEDTLSEVQEETGSDVQDLVFADETAEAMPLFDDVEMEQEEDLIIEVPEEECQVCLQKCENGEIAFAEADVFPETEDPEDEQFTECRAFTEGSEVFLLFLPEAGYKLSGVEVKTLAGNDVVYELTDQGACFLMPGESVFVHAEFVVDEDYSSGVPEENEGDRNSIPEDLAETAGNQADGTEDDGTPEERPQEDGLSEDGFSEDGTSEDGTSEDGTPEEGVPEDGIPEEIPAVSAGYEKTEKTTAYIENTGDEADEADASGAGADKEDADKADADEANANEADADEADADEVDAEESLLQAASTTYTLSDSVKASFTDGILTITGTGDIPAYSDGNVPWDKDSVTKVIIKEGITSIGDGVFQGHANLQTVTLPKTLTSIEYLAFAESGLQKITLPENVKSIGSAAFAECTALTEIVTNNKLESVGDNFIWGTENLKNFTVPASLTGLTGETFRNNCLTGFTVKGNNYTVKNGNLASADGKTLISYAAGSPAESFSCNGYTKIGTYAFASYGNLKNVDLNGVTELERYAFVYNYSLTSVSFGNSLTKMDLGCFYRCDGLKSVDFGTSISELPAQTFAYCYLLEDITLPGNIKKIGNGCFGFCLSLNRFTSMGLTNVPYEAFSGCRNLNEVNLNEGLTSISRQSFKNCSALTSVTIPSTCTFVASDAFYNGTELIFTNDNNNSLLPYGNNGYIRADQVNVSGKRDYTKAFEVLELVNAERAKQGLSALYMDSDLLEAAMIRAAECSVCFSHTRPDSSICFSANSKMIAENIAAGSSTAGGAMNVWMNSQGHKENIMNASHNSIGIGCFIINGTYYWTQCFGSYDPGFTCARPENTSVSQTVTMASDEFTDAPTGSGVVFGKVETYSYTYRVTMDNATIRKGTAAKANVSVKNGCSDWSVYTLLNDDSVKWSSSNTAVATVDGHGRVVGIGKGMAEITATSKQGRVLGSVTVAVYTTVPVNTVALDKTRASLNTGSGLTVKATVSPADATNKKVTWTSSNTSVAAVDANGKIVAKGPGTANITVKTADGGKTAVCKVTVTQPVTSIRLNKTAQTITAGKTAALTTAVSPSNASNKKVTWTSSNTAVATVNASGVVTAKKAGTAKITVKAADGSGKTAVCTVTVKAATVAVTGVKLNKTKLTMGNGQNTTLTATVSPSNATNKKVTWKSSNTKLATVSSTGKVTTAANANGTVKITATTADGKKVAACTITVKKPSVSYRTHVQTFGWQDYVKDGVMSGTQGKAKRLEGINIKLSNLPYSGSIVYRTHVQTYGWQTWRKDGAMSGTSGEAKRLEGIQIYLTGELAKHYDVYYRVHAQTYGWLDYAKNGVMAGTSGLAKRLEGINIYLVPKGGKAPGATANPYVVGGGGKLPENPYKG